MLLNNLSKRISHKVRKTRVGRGIGSGHGGHTSLRGNKGQKSRTGGKVPLYFEGGQLPFVKRLPHLKGFRSFRKRPAILKTSVLNKIDIDREVITPKQLLKLQVIKKLSVCGVKLLKDVEISKKLNLHGFLYSKSAKQSIEKAGGKAE